MAEKIRIASENYVDEKLRDIDVDVTGTVEITDGTPEKEGTVLTVNPEAEEISVYSAEEVDALVAVERARIDQFVALEEGSTTGDAELIDARIDKDGVTHANVGDHIRSITSQLSGQISNLPTGGSGVTTGQANSLWAIIQKTAFTEQVTEEELNVFKTAWGITDSGEEPDAPEVTLTSISATYTGGEVTVGTALTDLTGITVTAHYSDSATANVTGYTLSGEIVEGSNTITVSYNGLTTTFTVTGIAESGGDEPEPLYGTFWPPAGKTTNWSNIKWEAVENSVYSGNTGQYIDAGLPSATFIRFDKLQGNIYVRTLTSNKEGTLPSAYTVYANSDGEISTGGFEKVPTIITKNLGSIEVNNKTYYFVLFKFEIPSGKTGYFASQQTSANSGYFISEDGVHIDDDYKQYYTLFTSDPTDRITEGATEVNA